MPLFAQPLQSSSKRSCERAGLLVPSPSGCLSRYAQLPCSGTRFQRRGFGLGLPSTRTLQSWAVQVCDHRATLHGVAYRRLASHERRRSASNVLAGLSAFPAGRGNAAFPDNSLEVLQRETAISGSRYEWRQPLQRQSWLPASFGQGTLSKMIFRESSRHGLSRRFLLVVGPASSLPIGRVGCFSRITGGRRLSSLISDCRYLARSASLGSTFTTLRGW